jgi:hypothetical protein
VQLGGRASRFLIGLVTCIATRGVGDPDGRERILLTTICEVPGRAHS